MESEDPEVCTRNLHAASISITRDRCDSRG